MTPPAPSTVLPVVLLYLRLPIAGKTKTRLAQELGADQAAALSRAMTEMAVEATLPGAGTAWELCLYVSEEADIPAVREWLFPNGTVPEGVRFLPQPQGTLAERLEHSLVQTQAAPAVLFVGSDCPAMTKADLRDALAALESSLAVLGPAADGGFWLLGVQQPCPIAIFRDVRFSAPETAADMRASLERHGLGPVTELGVKADVDFAADLKAQPEGVRAELEKRTGREQNHGRDARGTEEDAQATLKKHHFFLLAFLFLLLSLWQLQVLPHGKPEGGGPWFLFGEDTVAHDAIVQLWCWGQFVESGGRLPLWMPPLQGGLPTLGAWLWTPLHPTLWLHAVLEFPLAQRAQWVLALWTAMLGGLVLGRALGLRLGAAVFLAVGYGLSGHVVTLIYPGHLQKVLALAWLPWCGAGLVRALPLGGEKASWRGVAVAGGALGLMFLSGHPQIAYIAAMVGVLRLLSFCTTDVPPVILKRGNHGRDGHGTKDHGREARATLLAAVFSPIGKLAAVFALGGLVGAAQLLPGLEMSRLSNRAGGVSWEEAVETSYPPGEVWEFVLPRFKGDSSRVGYGTYSGKWGQRLVSDYAGVAVVLLTPFAFVWRGRRREAAFWLAVAAIALLVGFGRHTPLYRVLYDWWPGMRSFRSPGTFFAAAALALPVLGAMGLKVVLEDWNLGTGFDSVDAAGQRRHTSCLFTVLFFFLTLPLLSFRVFQSFGDLGETFLRSLFFLWIALLVGHVGPLWCSGWLARRLSSDARGAQAAVRLVFASMALLLALDLSLANRAFLSAESWDAYSAYLAPSEVDLWAFDNLEEPRRVFDPQRPLSLQPILNGRDALLGYHPISYAAFEENLKALGAGSPEWRAQWGVRHIANVWTEPPPGLEATSFPAIVADPATPFPVLGADSWMWILREPNHQIASLRGALEAEVVIKETVAPGWRWRADDSEPWVEAREVSLERRVSTWSSVEWQYRPASWRVGLFLTVLGVVFLSMATVARSTKGARS